MKIGIYSDFVGLSSGYGQDTYIMLTELKNRGYEVINYAKQYTGFPIEVNGIKIYAGTDDSELRRSFMQSKPDVVISFLDLWQYSPYTRFGEHHIIDMVHEAGAKLANYSPIQQLPMPPVIDNIIDNDADFTIFPTKWATYYFRNRGHDRVAYVPHAVRDEYRYVGIPREKRPFNLPEGHMFMNVGFALDPRKQTPLVLKLLRDYREYDDTAFAYMHTQIHSFYANDVFQINLGLPKNSVIFKPYDDPGNNIHDSDVARMNLLYNSADLFVNFASSEGFGKPALEAASLGIPVMVTDTPVHREVLSHYPSVRFVKSYEWIPTVWWFEYMPDMDIALETALDIADTDFKKSEPFIYHEHQPSVVVDMLEKVVMSL